MPDRLSSTDVSFLSSERAQTPAHSGTVQVLRAPDEGFDYDRLFGLIRERIAFVPRYRQRLRFVPGHLANPVWVDDTDFDLTYHVRRSALPRPGTDEQLAELVARIMSRRLDRDRPLWEVYLVEGLEGNRLAILSKAHLAMVDGVRGIDIAQVMLDISPQPRSSRPDTWAPHASPGSAQLIAGAASDLLRRPTAGLDIVLGGVGEVRNQAGRLLSVAEGALLAVRTAARPAPPSPLNPQIGKARRFAMIELSLADFKRVKDYHETTVNDVVLAVITGALRDWLLTRGEVVRTSTTLRAMVPLSVTSEDAAIGSPNHVAPFVIDLPVGEPSPVVRLQRIAYSMRGYKEVGEPVPALSIAGVAGFAPPTLHILGARVATDAPSRVYNLLSTNVPGPQVPLFAAGAELIGSYPVVPLSRGQGLAVGVTSYNSGVFVGLNADRDAIGDLDVLASEIVTSADLLTDTVRSSGGRGRGSLRPAGQRR
jgi:diacylglycerol O-acyltransferase / wax synthase